MLDDNSKETKFRILLDFVKPADAVSSWLSLENFEGTLYFQKYQDSSRLAAFGRSGLILPRTCQFGQNEGRFWEYGVKMKSEAGYYIYSFIK